MEIAGDPATLGIRRIERMTEQPLVFQLARLQATRHRPRQWNLDEFDTISAPMVIGANCAHRWRPTAVTPLYRKYALEQQRRPRRRLGTRIHLERFDSVS